MQLTLSKMFRLVFIPYFGEFLQLTELGKKIARALLETRIPKAFVNPLNFTGIIRPLKMLMFYHLSKDGFMDAFLSSMRNFKLHDLAPVYDKGEFDLEILKIPLLILYLDTMKWEGNSFQ